MFIYIHVLSYYKLFLYFYLCLSVQLDRLSCSFTSMSFLTTSCSLTFTCVYVYNWIVSHVHLHPCPFLLPAVPLLLSVSMCTIGSSLMFIYIHVLSYYKLFLYCYLCLSVQLDRLSCSFTSMSFLTTSCSFTFICVYVYNWIVSHVHLHACPFLLQAVPLLLSVSKCTLGSSLMFIYIHVLSYYQLFLYFYLCLCVQLDRLSCSFTSISFLTTSCSFTFICV
jgi:hypothetical protein